MRDKTYPNIHFLSHIQEITRWGHKLPHWQQGNNPAYFITFRLRDSIPIKIARQIETQRKHWTHEHPKPWDASTALEYHKTFSTRIDKLLDENYGDCILQKEDIRRPLIETLRGQDQKHYLLHNWVIMPNHVHILATIPSATNLGAVIGTWKRLSAIRINRISNTSGSIWQKNYFDRIIRDWDHFQRVAKYIRKNPRNAKLGSAVYSYGEADWIGRILA